MTTPRTARLLLIIGSLAATLSLTACGGASSTDTAIHSAIDAETAQTATTASTTAAAAATAPATSKRDLRLPHWASWLTSSSSSTTSGSATSTSTSSTNTTSSGTSSSGTGASANTSTSGTSTASTGSTSTTSTGSTSTTSTSTSTSSTTAGAGTSTVAGATRTVAHALGINLAAVSYYSPEQPFLNLMKSGGTSSNLSGNIGWYTANNSAWDTNEEGYLQLDANGYPTSLSASSTPSGGQQFTFVRTLLNYNLPTAPGASTPYPAGTYRLKFIGQGTVVIGGDANLTLTNTQASAYVTATFTVSNPSSGLTLSITAINNSSDYPRDISVVQNTYASAYDSGAVFNPAFLSMLSGFSNLRFGNWKNVNNEFTSYTAAASLASSATSLTLSSPWALPSGSYPIVFIDGEQRTATFTLGSTAVSWSGGLNKAISSANNWTWGSQSYYATFYLVNNTWAGRSLPSNAFWSLNDGVPLEVAIALCNQLQAGCHLNVPLMYSDSDITAMAQLVMSGTAIQGGYAALASPLNASFELSNEVWNSIFADFNMAASFGSLTWPSSSSGGGNYEWNRNWFGMRTAQMASDLKSAVSSNLFTRVIPVLGAQAANTYAATDALAAPYWTTGTGAPSTYPIKAIAIAPYWGDNPSASDCTTMTGQSDGGLADFFATLYSQTGASGTTYSSVPSGGWMGQAEGWITAHAKLLSNYSGMKLIAYEGGQNFYATSSGTCANWPTLVAAAERDSRMGTAYTNYMSFWKTNVGDSTASINNLYEDVASIGSYGAWGLLETTAQPTSPLTSAPAKYQAAINYIVTP